MSEPVWSELTAVSARLDGMERWLERLSLALEKVADNRERLVAVEIRVSNMDITVTDLKRTVSMMVTENQTQDVQLARLDMVKATAIFVAGAIISTVGPALMRKLGL